MTLSKCYLTFYRMSSYTRSSLYQTRFDWIGCKLETDLPQDRSLKGLEPTPYSQGPLMGK